MYSFLFSPEDGGGAGASIVSARGLVFFTIALCRRLIVSLEC